MSSDTTTSSSVIGVSLVDVDVDAALDEIEANWGWILAEGMILSIFGSLVYFTPILSTAYVGVYTNAALCISGVINMLGLLFAERGYKIRSFLIGLGQLAMAGILEFYPLESLAAITTAIASGFMADGLFRIVLAEQNRGLPGWFWTLMGGLGSIAIGVYVLATLPVSSLETIGTLVGLNLLSAGAARINVAWLGRSMAIADKQDASKKTK